MNNRQVLSARFIASLERVQKGYPNDNKTVIAKVMGTQPNVVNDILKSKRKITIKQLEKYVAHYKLNDLYFNAENNKDIELFNVQPTPIHSANFIQPEASTLSEKKIRGKIFRKIREELGLSQEEIGASVGLNQSKWSQIEVGLVSASPEVMSRLHKEHGIRYEFMHDEIGPIRSTKSTNTSYSEELPEFKKFVQHAIVQVNQAIQQISNKDNSKLYVINESTDIHFT